MLASDAYLDEKAFLKKYNQKNVTAKAFNILDVKYFLVENKQHQILVFRGTSNLENFRTNSHFHEAEFRGEDNIEVHRGFYEIAVGAKMQLKNILSKDKKTTLVGHSLGGAISLLLGALLKDNGYNVHIYSFGMPAVGNKMFSIKYQDLPHDRYAHRFDIVALMKRSVIQTFKKIVALKHIVFKRELVQSVINYFESEPYKYVHHGTLHKLTNKPVKDEDIADKKFLQRQALKVLSYHRIETYKKGIMQP